MSRSSPESCRCKWAWGVILLAIAGLFVMRPTAVSAQESGMKVAFIRPSEGETFYASPTSPFASTPVTGWVDAGGFDVRQVQVRLEVFQGPKSYGSLTTRPQTNGTFTFDVAVNPERPASKSSGEYACQGNCHAITTLGMPSGKVLLRVTATDPLGRKATAERSVVSDHSGYADVPVHIVAADNPKQSIGELTVVADTWLYQWRARQYTVRADAQGNALLHLEALAQAPTRYVVHIQPIVLNGVFYENREPVQVILPPGATRADPVTLSVESKRGQIQGAVDVPAGSQAPSALTVRAIELPRGAVHVAKTALGKFSLNDLPIGRYLLTVDDEEAAVQGIQVAPQTIDVGARPIISATLAVSSAPMRRARGVVHDGNGSPLPFAWLSTEDRRRTGRVVPSSGAFALYGLPVETRALWVTAPGYWSKPIALDGDSLDITLTPQPDLRVIPAGSGTITLPPPTIGTLSGNQFSLKRGWVWGKGASSFVLTTPDYDIAVENGSFAVEYFPGQASWLYVTEGNARVTSSGTDGAIRMSAGQMLTFGPDAPHPAPVALDDASVRALHNGEAVPVRIEGDPAIPSRIRDAVEQKGIVFGQATMLAALGVVLLAVGAGSWRMRRRGKESRDTSMKAL